MPDGLEHELDEHLALAEAARGLLPQIEEVASLLIERFAAGNRVYTLGNGGSSLDAQHLAEELVGRFKRDRRPLPAQSLAADTAAITCIANDYSFDEIFERQVRAFAQPGGRRRGLHHERTLAERRAGSGRGARARRDDGALRRRRGRAGAEHADHALVVPSESTARIQELHVLLLHVLLERIDAWAAGGWP